VFIDSPSCIVSECLNYFKFLDIHAILHDRHASHAEPDNICGPWISCRNWERSVIAIIICMVPMCLSLGKSSLITGFVRFGVSSPSPMTPFGESAMSEVLELWTE